MVLWNSNNWTSHPCDFVSSSFLASLFLLFVIWIRGHKNWTTNHFYAFGKWKYLENKDLTSEGKGKDQYWYGRRFAFNYLVTIGHIYVTSQVTKFNQVLPTKWTSIMNTEHSHPLNFILESQNTSESDDLCIQFLSTNHIFPRIASLLQIKKLRATEVLKCWNGIRYVRDSFDITTKETFF